MNTGLALDQTRRARAVTRRVETIQTEDVYNYRTGELEKDIGVHLKSKVRQRGNIRVVLGLIKEWQAATAYLSDLDQMAEDRYFSAIVSIGNDAVPGILQSIADSPSWIVMALEEITKERPYSDDDLGSVELISRRWIEWGSANASR